MKKKLMFLFGTVTMAFILTTVGWFLLKPKNETSKVERVDTDSTGTVKPNETAQSPTKREEALLTPAERRAQRTRQRLEEYWEDTEQAEDSYLQELKRAQESPAYEEYWKQQLATPGFSFKLYFDFLESQGVYAHRDMYENNFRKYYPTGSLASYEPMMRKRLAALFLEAPPIDPTDPAAVQQQLSDVMDAFGKAPEQSSWVLAYFLGVGQHEWAKDIQKNAASILADSTEFPNTEPARFTNIEQNEDFSFVRHPQQTQENVDIPSDTDPHREVPPRLEALEPIPENAGALEAELVKDLFADIPNFPNEADFQQMLRERFSPQRFNTAMQTLSRYGLEEGLRRLKESDPEIATHVERLIQPNKETD